MLVLGEFIGRGLADYAARAYQGDDALLRLYRQHRVRYEIAIVLPDAQTPAAATAGGQQVYYRFEFGGGRCESSPQRSLRVVRRTCVIGSRPPRW